MRVLMSTLVVVVLASVGVPAAATKKGSVLCGDAPPFDRVMPTQRIEVDGVTVWRPEVVCHGQLLVIAVESTSECPEPTLLWQQRRYDSFEVSESQRHALLPVPLTTDPGEYPVHLDCGGQQAPFDVRVARATYPSSELRVKRKFTREPPPRTEKEREIIKEAFATTQPERSWTEAFVRPATMPMTSPFGTERTFNQKLESQHRGLDIDGRPGDPIMASNDGVVVLAAKSFYYVGNAVFIDHGQSLYSVYFHMRNIYVETGDRVTRGQRIGTIGKTGRVTGPHLHFGIKLDGFYVDPRGVLAYRPEEVTESGSTAEPSPPSTTQDSTIAP